jgi:general secretion pathway protein G
MIVKGLIATRWQPRIRARRFLSSASKYTLIQEVSAPSLRSVAAWFNDSFKQRPRANLLCFSATKTQIDNMKPAYQRGFSLLEIIVVIAIMAIMAAIVVPKLFGNVAVAQKARVKADVKAISSALEMYRLDNFVFPSTEQGLAALVNKPGGQPEAPNWRTGGYIDGMPKDPWNTPYQFLNPGQHGSFDVYSLGADRKPGGEGNDADIGNWEG